ncbi:cysteine-rich CWC family protein [Agriterribacter sp.]|uniref:cysteine-rich CWC family protein n=1 Tax=Agriterribacter sp. TaxID=2821509 RepID=UPI002CE7EFDC|nr:cysteine-rich CWC family protein [Agriterribacter sp.]HRP55804.1 cysteine-rich CWC family protein [Agriterribacter sp.]
MEKHEEKYCPKCNSRFTCRSGDIANCQCNTIELSEATQDFLLRTSFDCLCKSCLEKLNRDIKTAKGYQFPVQKEMLIEGLHYYKENDNLVFTALYHILRGYCCQSGCRHCAYGYKKDISDQVSATR